MIWDQKDSKAQEHQLLATLLNQVKRVFWFREHMRTYNESQWLQTSYWEVSSEDTFSDQNHELKSTGTLIWSDDMFKRNSFKKDIISAS